MSDLRARYRAVPYMGIWRLEIQHWWWPFWIYVRHAADEERAWIYAWEHANPNQASISIGPMAGEPRP
jgi:hypothetical protein